VAESFPRRAVAGTIAALTAVVLTATACVPDPDLPCDPSVTADSLGIATGSGLDAMPTDRLDRYLDLVDASGARWIRFDVDWSTVEPERGRSDWSGVDRVVAAAVERGLQVLGLITNTPAWARIEESGDDSHGRPSDPAEFGRFAGDAAARYAGTVRHWEIWNEPNLTQFFTPAPDVEQYARLLSAAATAIRAAAPDAVIVTGGLSPATDNGTDISPTTFLDELYDRGAEDDFDAVGMHPYSYPALPSDAGTRRWNAYYRMRNLHAVMADHDDGDTRIWATEFGAPTGSGEDSVSPDEQAEILRDGINEQRRLPFVDKLFVYSLVDRGNAAADREQNFGIVDHDLDPKPAMAVVQRAASTPGCI